MDKHIIYRATFPNGKCYVGRTKQTLQRRINQHINDPTGCPLCHKAIHTFGKENVKWDILQTVNTLQQAKQAEAKHTRKNNAFNPNGYNIADGYDNITHNIKHNYLTTPTIPQQEFQTSLDKYIQQGGIVRALA